MKPVYSAKQVQLLETAERLFSEKGFDGTSVRDIAEEAGINTAMISYYFGSKEKLMEAIFEQRSLNVREKIDELLEDQSMGPLEKMYRLLDEYVEKIVQGKQFHRILLCEQVINKNPVIIEMVGKIKARNLTSINDIITLGQDKGIFNKDIDVPMMMNTLIGTISHMLVSLDFYRSYHKLEDIPDQDFEKLLKKRLSAHIKIIFKAILTNES